MFENIKSYKLTSISSAMGTIHASEIRGRLFVDRDAIDILDALGYLHGEGDSRGGRYYDSGEVDKLWKRKVEALRSTGGDIFRMVGAYQKHAPDALTLEN